MQRKYTNTELTELLGRDELIKELNLRKYHLTWLADVLMILSGANEINKFYSAIPPEPVGIPFLETAMKNLKVNFPIPEADLRHIPKEGAFVTVSNHPFGLLDGILLILILGRIRPDVKIMANFLLQRQPPLRDFFIPVDPFEGKNQAVRSLAGTKLTLQHLKDGHPVGIFPAGEVSTYQKSLSSGKLLVGKLSPNSIQDRDWQPAVMKIIKKSKVPVIPIFFHGHNSPLFHLLGKISPKLRTIRLLSEFLNKKGKYLPIRIGAPISVEKQNEFDEIEALASFLKAQTYALGES
jgi:putative hemolysin